MTSPRHAEARRRQGQWQRGLTEGRRHDQALLCKPCPYQGLGDRLTHAHHPVVALGEQTAHAGMRRQIARRQPPSAA